MRNGKTMTDEERCEVAAELRELAEDYEKVPAWDVIAAGELPAPVDDVFMACGLGRAVHVTEICGRLADLIDPTDETCELELTWGGQTNAHVRTYECNKCGKSCDSVWGEEYEYCPYCGRRVENADE